MLRAVIMAGGSGTRFWPLSRQKLPKQFLNVFGERSLLQLAYERIVELVGERGVYVVTNEKQVAKTREQLPDLPAEHVIGEPVGRDTAACIALSAALLASGDPHSRMIVLAADHLIGPTEKFHAAIRAADRFVQDHPDALVTFGVKPARPATEYGYLRRAKTAATFDGVTVHKLHSFHEKPPLDRAKEFFSSGEHYWNSGIFCWRSTTILDEITKASPELASAVGRIVDAWNTPKRESVLAREYQALPKISIDYAVMEKSQNVFMVEPEFEWDDVGNWLALERVRDGDASGNVTVGKVLAEEAKDCVVVGSDDHLVALLGAEDLIVVRTPDVTLVASKSHEQSVKKLIARLEQEGKTEYL